MIVLRLLLFLAGATVVVVTFLSAIRTFVLPRGVSDGIVKFVFRGMRRVFGLYVDRAESYEARDNTMAMFAPVTLITLALTWMALVDFGYTLIYLGIGAASFNDAFLLSGSSLLTLGFVPAQGMVQDIAAFSEAAIGLILVALLISYLPTMYSAFAKRESAVTLLSVRAGDPPSAVELLTRYSRIEALETRLPELWIIWELWFAEVEESHTSLAALVFFRSPQPDRSWITAAGTVLDAAALRASVLDLPRDPQAELTIRAGFIALRHIAAYFGIPYPQDPHYPETHITISKDEFLRACDEMRANGVPLKQDLNQAWLDYAGWRVNYDTVLLALALLTMAPYAPWVSDRSLSRQQLPKRLIIGAQEPEVLEET